MVSVDELKRMRDADEPHLLIDVREQNEYDAANIGGTLIPLSQFVARAGEIPREGLVVIHCKMGGRSQQAVDYLKSLGYGNVENLTGGIMAWAEKFDPAMSARI